MAIFNTWITPLQRSYQSIKNRIIENLKIKVPEITDYSEGNIFIILINIFAAIAEVIHYYIDNMARETFLVSARRLTSVVKHAQAVDYKIKAAHPSTVDVVIYREDGSTVNADITIPINTQFISNDGQRWLTANTVVWRSGTYSIIVPLVQKELATEQPINLGNIIDPGNVISLGNIPNNKQYAEGSMSLWVNDILWTLVNTFAYYGPNDKVYKVELDEDFEPVIVFGDGKFGQQPSVGHSVKASYYITNGQSGNINTNNFSTVPTLITSIINNPRINNQIPSSGGTNYEDFSTIKANIPLSIKTLGVAITKEDWEAIVKLVPGVNKSYINYICGRFVEVYITPISGTEASTALMDEVKSILEKSKVLTTSITVKSTKPSYAVLKATITGRKSFSKNDIDRQVRKAIIDRYNPNTSEINRPVRLSDLYSIIDQQSTVDYLTIDQLYFKPLIYPVTSGQVLPIVNVVNFEPVYFTPPNESILFERATIEIISSTQYRVTRVNGITSTHTFDQIATITTIYSQFKLNISKSGVVYNIGDRYTIVIQRPNKDLIPYDYTIPLITTENINLTINETV